MNQWALNKFKPKFNRTRDDQGHWLSDLPENNMSHVLHILKVDAVIWVVPLPPERGGLWNTVML